MFYRTKLVRSIIANANSVVESNIGGRSEGFELPFTNSRFPISSRSIVNKGILIKYVTPRLKGCQSACLFCASLSHVLLLSQTRTSCSLQIIVSFVIVLLCHVDDMEIAPDFFDYFEATAPILDADESLYAVSSWNDNGQTQFVHDSGKVSPRFRRTSV